MTSTMSTRTSAQTQTDKAPGVICGHCAERVKLNEIIRSATHDLGCIHCYGNQSR